VCQKNEDPYDTGSWWIYLAIATAVLCVLIAIVSLVTANMMHPPHSFSNFYKKNEAGTKLVDPNQKQTQMAVTNNYNVGYQQPMMSYSNPFSFQQNQSYGVNQNSAQNFGGSHVTFGGNQQSGIQASTTPYYLAQQGRY